MLRPLHGHQDQAPWLPQPLWLTAAIQQAKKTGQGQSQENDHSSPAANSNQGKRSADTAFGGSRNKNNRSGNRGYGGNYGGGYNKNRDRDQSFRGQGSQGDNRGNYNSNSGSWNPPQGQQPRPSEQRWQVKKSRG